MLMAFWVVLCRRLREALGHTAEGDRAVLQGPGRDPAGAVRNGEDGDFLLWDPAADRLRARGMPGPGSRADPRACPADREGHAGARRLPRGEGPRLRRRDQRPGGPAHSVERRPRRRGHPRPGLRHAPPAVSPAQQHQDVRPGRGRRDALPGLQGPGAASLRSSSGRPRWAR